MYKLKTYPWSHQWAALDYMMTHKQAALFTDMGSGKTKIMIDMIQNRGFESVIIVGTKKSCDVWEDEFKTHSLIDSDLVFKLSNMSTADKLTFIEEKTVRGQKRLPEGVYIVNYDSVWREPFSKLILRLKVDCVICDESHRMKSPSAKASRFLARLGKKVEYKYILSGTPTSESPLDVYGQYRFLDPDIFGTNYGYFKNLYTNIDQRRSAFCGFPVLDSKKPYKNLDQLKDKIYSCAFKADSNVILPEVTHIYKETYISTKAQKIYKEIDKEGVYVDSEGILETNNILTKHLRLQQLLSGYLNLESEDFTEKFLVKKDNSKPEILFDILENISFDEKVVIFAKFRKDFDEIQVICKKLKRSYGEISGQRDDYKRWKQGKVNVLTVHYSSGSESISLIEARYCIYYSHTFSYGQYLQSLKRVHRPKQTRPVIYYHLIAKVKGVESVDDRIQAALKQKKNYVDYIMEKEG